jgi:hypothetical protein
VQNVVGSSCSASSQYHGMKRIEVPNALIKRKTHLL